MFKRFLRCMSTLLVLVMLINMVPVQALGELQSGEIGQIGGMESITTTPTGSADSAEPATIVAEIPEGRSEYSKEFLLSNGLHMATVYAEPVHYEKDGKWEDIDNTLVANIDGTYKNTAGPWEVSFPQSFGSSQAITVTKDGYTLSFGMPQRLTSNGNSGAVVMSADSTAEPLATAQAATVTAQVDSKADLLAVKAEAEHPETVLDKLSSRLTYENVHSDTNVIYDLDSNQVKESIVLEKQDAALRGFRYTLNVGTMIPVLEEDGTILLYSEDQTQIVMVMPAPYLMDAAYEISDDITVTLNGANGKYVLTYMLPQQWLADEARQWPVILDPVIHTDLERANIQDVLVCSKQTISPYGSYLEVGYLTNRGISRTYVNFAELPTLTSADVIVGAQMYMEQMWNRSISVPAQVHKVTEKWDQETITWNDQPQYDPTIVDFVMGNKAQDYYWDVTDIVQDWYNEGGEFYGFLFKTSNAIENAGVEKFRQFYSANYGYIYRPALLISFRNNNGLESYWDYTSSSAGRAGTGHVNDYTGNLVWIRSDMGFGGNRMPVSISHIYNANDAANNSFGMGYGWRTNYNQLVYQWDEDSDGTIQSDEIYYVWEDTDGTKHYFKKVSTNKYEEEDDSTLVLTVSGSGSSKTVTITDKNDNKSYFDSKGRLYKLENNQATKSSNTVTYQDATSKLIASVTDGAGRVYSFQYNTDGLLSRISFKGTQDTEITYVAYEYTDGNLHKAIDKDQGTSVYEYDANHLLTSAADIDGYKLVYTYNVPSGTYAPCRVESIREYDGDTPGGHITIAYKNNQTTFTDVVNGTTVISQFNNFGNTKAIQDDEGRAQYADFARNDPSETTGKGNQLTLSSKLQNTVINLLSDSSFENNTNWISSNSSVCSISTAEHYLGSKSLKVAGGNAFSPSFTAKANTTYTLSGYVKVVSGNARLAITNANVQYGEMTSLITNCDWTRFEVSYTNNTSADQELYAVIRGTDETYLDCVQLEKMPTASRYNLVNNGDFASADGWTRNNLVDADMLTTAPDAHQVLNSNAYKITGEYTTAKSVKQTITVSGGEGDSYVFGGWAMGNSAALGEIENSGVTKDFGIKCTIYNGTEVVKEETAQFNPNVTQWQFVSGAIAATGDYTSITIEAVYINNVNTVYFDGLQLFKEEFGVSYTYDDDGNVISVIDLQQKNTTYEYSNNDLTKIMQDGKTKMEYTYDDYHNVLTATTQEKLKYEFKYDTYGNNTEVSISVTDEETSATSTITSKAEYSTDGNLMVKTIDALGKETAYGYDADTGLAEWIKYPEDSEATRTEYTYDNMYRTATVATTTDTALNLSANYTYEDDLLTAIQTPSTTYTFTYGDFSLRTSIDIGERNLARYTYEAGTNRLKKLDYGNGGKVEYTYDSQGRLIQEEYEDGETVSYAYDNSGNLATVTDSETGTVTTYYYDLLNRQSGYREQGVNLDHTVKYEYDENNNLATLTETINGVTKTYSYTYDEDNRIKTETVDGITVTYTYDSFGRLSQKVTSNGTTQITSESYQFTSPETGASSAQISGVIVDPFEPEGSADSKTNYSYTYDGNGNILSVSDGTNTTSYVYDSANQLIRENNQAKNYTKVWTYDDAGNIQSRTEYTYTTVENLDSITPTDTVNYGYDDTEWKDLLTSYDGKTITYDEIGNPLNDGEWTYTWQHGRQLESMSQTYASGTTTTWTYTYDANGMRTGRTCSNGYTYEYIYNGSQLSSVIINGSVYRFTYDSTGIPLTMTSGNTVYYYVTNTQGDVTGILNSEGVQITTYVYDAWGKMYASSTSPIIMYNPLTYRGYVYDRETGLYYAGSRYYDPEIGRWLNPDTLETLGVEFQNFSQYNLFAYCFNSPVNQADGSGTWPKWAKKLVAAVAVVAVVAVAAAVSVATAGAGAAVSCALVGAAHGAAVGLVSGAASGAVTAAVSHRIQTGSWEGAGQAALDGMADGALSGAISGAISGGMNSSYCFVAGTAVLTACGYVAIENITAGDMVYAWDEETGTVGIKEVVETYINETSELVHVFVSGEEIITTPSHPFYSPVKGWTDAVHLRAGDILVTVNGELVVVEKIQHEILESPITVYNFQVEGYHTYYVTNNGILVHNECKISGGGHGNKTHRQQIDNKIAQLESTGNYTKIYGNRSLNTAGLKGNQRPDIIAINSNGTAEIWEYASPSQYTNGYYYRLLVQKINLMRAQNPGAIFHDIIPWSG